MRCVLRVNVGVGSVLCVVEEGNPTFPFWGRNNSIVWLCMGLMYTLVNVPCWCWFTGPGVGWEGYTNCRYRINNGAQITVIDH